MFQRTARDEIRISPGIPDEIVDRNSLSDPGEVRYGTVLEFHPVAPEAALSNPHQDS